MHDPGYCFESKSCKFAWRHETSSGEAQRHIHTAYARKARDTESIDTQHISQAAIPGHICASKFLGADQEKNLRRQVGCNKEVVWKQEKLQDSENLVQ